MTDVMRSRGPDDSGYWVDSSHGVAFGQRRLSILDLSEHGRQPMHTPDGRYVIVYNGEVYNFLELAQELLAEGRSIKSRCDTEVVLAAIAAWGIERALKSFNGMFAFAVLDRKEQTLTIARDRLGIKPIYFGWNSGVFVFASELKPFHQHPALKLEIDHSAVALYMRHNYIPAPYSIFKGVYKLVPGTFYTLSLRDSSYSRGNFQPWPSEFSDPERPTYYWSPRQIFEKCQNEGWCGSEDEAIDSLHELLRDSVRLQLISDVPLGIFLSGGIDSSLVVALAQSLSTKPMKTFSIGFHEKKYDEAPFARAVAQQLRTEHTEFYIQGQDALDVVPKLPYFFDEPFSDSSQIPTFLVSQLARKQVTVALSGDGGDELFCGYSRYSVADRKWKAISRLPYGFRSSISRMAGLLQKFVQLDLLERLHYVLQQKDPEFYYRWVISHWRSTGELVLQSSELPYVLSERSLWPRSPSFIDTMMYLDIVSYLPDDLLVKGDRASMAASLEGRVPILDHRVVEFAWKLPISLKLRGLETKWILKKILEKHIPRSLFDRRKQGFAVPISDWLCGPLRSWAHEMLESGKIRSQGIFDEKLVSTAWKNHLSGKQGLDAILWDILMFQSWMRVYRD